MKGSSLLGVIISIAIAPCFGIGSAVAQSPNDPAVRELIRKAEAQEEAGTFCTGLNWVPGSYDTYKQFLERADRGTWKLNIFKGGDNCQYDRVNVAFKKDGINCVTYTWWACNKGARCMRGTALACKNPQGDWDTENE
jgi:hypothetical protein